MLSSILAANAILTRPFRQQVDVETVVLALALALIATGGWHLVLERIDL